MGLLRPKETRANFENPSISLSDASLIQLYGGGPTTAGPDVSETSAVSGTLAVYRAVSLLAGSIGGLPLRAYRLSGRSEVFPRLLQDPGNGLTPFELWEMVCTHLLLWGNAYVYKHRNSYTAIDALVPINPGRIKTKILPSDQSGIGEPVKMFEVQQANGKLLPLTNYDLMHIPGLGYDGIKGLSPIGVARQAIGILSAADELAAKLYSSGNMMSGILTTDRPLKQEQADAIKARWRDKLQGNRHAHDIAVLDSGTTFVPTSMAPDVAQFLQTRQWQMEEIARLYGIPPQMLGDRAVRSTATGIEQQSIEFVAYTLQPWIRRIEQRVSKEIVIPTTQFVEFDTAGLLRGAIGERYAAYASGIQWGHLTRNEAREMENRTPIDGLDLPLTPLNMIAGTGDENGVMAPNPPAPDTPTKSISGTEPLKGVA
jgi:HK97 family phage portal protein